MYSDIIQTVMNTRTLNFDEASEKIIKCVDADKDFLNTLRQIGTIPECIYHDSTEEKLFSKASDAVLSRAFREIGLKSTVLKERGDSADVQAASKFHNYTLVADAKAFRMSRTAKNQKDFKVVALSGWRKDSNYAVLCSPYFQYPSKSSQIYSQAISENVCLFSWEHMIFLIENHIQETTCYSFKNIWNFCAEISKTILYKNMKKSFIFRFNQELLKSTGKEEIFLNKILNEQIQVLIERGNFEKEFWINEIKKIGKYSREEAISELIKAKKIYEKIEQIDTYVGGLKV